MSEEKTAKVEKCVFSNKWSNPNGEDVFYHELHLDNGEKVSCGTTEKYPEKITEGAEITYIMNKGKIKLIKKDEEYSGGGGGSSSGGNKKKSNGGGGGGAKSYKKKPEDYLGYVSRYAVDLVIAGKTDKKSIDKVKSIMRELYQEHIDLLDNPLAPTSENEE